VKKELGFWLAVACVAIAGVAVFKIVGAKVGDRVPAVSQLAAFI